MPSLGIAQQPRQRSLAVKEREIAHILAVVLDQVEGIEDCSSSALPMGQLLEQRQTVGPQYNRSPSIVKVLALMRRAAVAMADSRAVQSWAMRL
jgi:hypothetical protein